MAGLPNADQAWVTIAPDLSKWMGDLTPVGSAAAAKLFSTFVLAAAHDAGMNTTNGIDLVTRGAAAAIFVAALSAVLPIPGIALLLAATGQAPDVMLDLAITQKDSTTTMLNLGTR